ncbi:MAG: iron-containing alcohol dehydrogenase [Bacteroidales bacterium]|nr:iron-containing alcohol dehydrogenase [Bacteroidales bacterium]
MYITRKAIRKLPGKVMKTVPIPEPDIIKGFGCRGQIGRICREAGIRYGIYDEINSEPKLDYIETGRSIALKNDAKCIISLGGGSVMDTGKMIAAGCRLKHLPAQLLLQKFLIVPQKTVPVIAIPSTAGTGAVKL